MPAGKMYLHHRISPWPKGTDHAVVRTSPGTAARPEPADLRPAFCLRSDQRSRGESAVWSIFGGTAGFRYSLACGIA